MQDAERGMRNEPRRHEGHGRVSSVKSVKSQNYVSPNTEHRTPNTHLDFGLILLSMVP